MDKHETYQKINTLYKRHVGEKKGRLIVGDFSMPEFEYLYNNLWSCEEKIDGTNVHCFWDGHIQTFHGKTENAVIPAHLLKKMEELFTIDKLKNIFPIRYDDHGVELAMAIRIYGEGYGFKIQKGHHYIAQDVNVIIFDVRVDNWWLSRQSVEDIAVKLNIPATPLIGIMTLSDAEKMVTEGFKSTIAENENYDAEGLVCKPTQQLFDRTGKRIITKIKTCDYRKLQ